MSYVLSCSILLENEDKNEQRYKAFQYDILDFITRLLSELDILRVINILIYIYIYIMLILMMNVAYALSTRKFSHNITNALKYLFIYAMTGS